MSGARLPTADHRPGIACGEPARNNASEWGGVVTTFDGLFSDAADGLPLKHALTYFLTDPPMIDANGEDVARHLTNLRLKREAQLSKADLHKGKNAEFIFSTRLIWWLSSGMLYATAFQPNSLVRVTVPKEYWTKVELDLEESAARANGIAITGVLVFEARAPAVETARPAVVTVEPVLPAAKRHVSEAELREWYNKRVRDWPDGKKSPNSDADFEDAKRHFADNTVTRDSVRTMRKDRAPPAWTAPGRPRKPARKITP